MNGYIYIVFYCLFNAFSFVFISVVGNTHGQAQSIVYVFTLGLLLFNLLNISNLKILYTKTIEYFRPVIGLNVTTAISWAASFYALKFIDPATMLCIAMATIPITTFFIMTPLEAYKSSITTILSIGFVVISMLLIIHENINYSGAKNASFIFSVGVLISIIGGVFGAAIGTYSEQLHKAKFNVKEILAIRFYFLILFGLIVAIATHRFQFNFQTLKLFSLSTVIIVILPLVIYQKAIQHLGSLTVSILIPFTPILAYFMQLVLHQYQFHIGTLMAILLCCVAMGILNVVRYKQIKIKKTKAIEEVTTA